MGMVNPRLNQAYEKFLLALSETIKFQVKNGVDNSERQNKSLDFIKQQYEILTKTDVNLLTDEFEETFKKIYKKGLTLVHPDLYPKDEANAQKITASYEAYDTIIKEIDLLKQHNIMEYYYSPTTYSSTQGSNQSYGSRPGYNYNQQGNGYSNSQGYNTGYYNQNGYGGQQSSYYQQSYGYQSNTHQAQYDSEDVHGFEANTYGSWNRGDAKTEQPEFFKTVKNAWDLYVRKIPTTYEDYNRILNFYQKKISSTEKEVASRKRTFDNVKSNLDKINIEWNNATSVWNIEEEYRRECARLNAKAESARKECQRLNELMNRRVGELQSEFDQRVAEYEVQYRRYFALYSEIYRLIQSGGFDLNRIYLNTDKTYEEMFQEASNYLNAYPNRNIAIARIESSILKNDKKYSALEQALMEADQNWRNCGRDYSDWYNNPLEKKNQLLLQINSYYSNLSSQLQAKVTKASNLYENICEKLDDLRQRLATFMEMYGHLDYHASEKGTR